MDKEGKTKNTLSFEGMGLENPTVVISTVTTKVRCLRKCFNPLSM
jgi:hypothetical protein